MDERELSAHAIDRFIIGVDGSPESRAALRFGASVAADIGAKVRVATAWGYPAVTALPFGPKVLDPNVEEDAAMTRVRDVIGDELGDDASLAEPIVLRGRPSQSLLRFASEPPGAVVVVGARGQGGFTNMVLGSTCRALLHDDRVPVVVVHPSQPIAPERLTHIVVGVDGTPGSYAASKWAAKLAARLQADVTAVHGLALDADGWQALGDPDVMRHLQVRLDGPWSDPFRDAGVTCTTKLVEEDPRSAILRVATAVGAGLVVMGRSSGSGRSRWAIGNVSESVVRHAGVPVAVVSADEGR